MPRGRDEAGSESQEGAISFETLRDEGQHFVHVQQYDKAIESFTKALELKQDDQQCLVTRSKCYLMVGNADASLADAESALEQDKKFPRGLYQKAEALYQKGDFETALMFYHRGHKLRPELQEFRLGIQKSKEAIENSIGQPDSVKLKANEGDMSYFYRQEEAKKQQRGAYQKPTAKKEERKERDAPKGTADSKTIKQLLGELYGDRDFLERLLKDQCITGKNNRNDKSHEIKDKVIDGLEYLQTRAEFWRQQKPMYARHRDRERQARARQSHRPPKDAMAKVIKNLEEIDDAMQEGRFQDSLEKAKATLKIVETASDTDIQNKAELTASLHSSMGNAYLEMGKLNQALDHHEEDLRIARENGLDDARSRALDNLGRVYARKGDYERAIDVWQEKIPDSKSALESTWLYHEIGRCYLELGKFADARDYGEKSLAAAREAEDDGWQLHASVLVAQSEVKLCDYQAAADSFEKSLELARKQNDTAAEAAITHALDEVNEKIVRGVKDGDQEDEGQTTDQGTYEDDFEHATTTDKGKTTDPELLTDRKDDIPLSTSLTKETGDEQKEQTQTETDTEQQQQQQEQQQTTEEGGNVDAKEDEEQQQAA